MGRHSEANRYEPRSDVQSTARKCEYRLRIAKVRSTEQSVLIYTVIFQNVICRLQGIADPKPPVRRRQAQTGPRRQPVFKTSPDRRGAFKGAVRLMNTDYFSGYKTDKGKERLHFPCQKSFPALSAAGTEEKSRASVYSTAVLLSAGLASCSQLIKIPAIASE